MPIYKSPSTSIRNVDIIPKPTIDPNVPGVPGLVIGTARRGIPFVPITVPDFRSFKAIYGDMDSTRFGPIALHRWLQSRGAGAYLKVLGVGDGKSRIKLGENAGSVKNSGFVVGSQLVQTGTGVLTHNSYANVGGPPGRTYFLGCFMSESAGSTIFSDAMIQPPGTTEARPIIRGVLMAPSGVTLSLNTEKAANNTPVSSAAATGKFGASFDGGLSFGDVLLGSGDQQKFIVILNGFKPHGDYTSAITASFDPNAPLLPTPTQAPPMRVAFNTDPTKIEEAGHYLHLFYDITQFSAEVTGSGITSHKDTNNVGDVPTDGFNAKLYQTAFLLSGTLSRNIGSATTSTHIGNPNFENFENRYASSFSPSVFSQDFLGRRYDLFKVHALDAGEASALNYKVTISGFDVGPKLGSTEYPKFDLHVRRIDQSDKAFGSVADPTLGSLETFTGLTLDPRDPKFISKVIGDKHLYYDFDKSTRDGQKIVEDGNYPGGSALIRIEVTEDVENGNVPPNALPIGFRGLHHYVTSGSSAAGPILSGTAEVGSGGSLVSVPGITTSSLKRIVQPPVPMRESIFTINESDGKKVVDNVLTWGFQVENKLSLSDPNKLQTFNTSSLSFMQYMPDFHTNYQNVWVGDNHGQSDVGGSILDADRFNNNVFTLGRIEVIKDVLDKPDKDQWAHAIYNRSGKPKTRLLNSDGVLKPSRFLRDTDFIDKKNSKYLQFTFPLIGGYDGSNIFDYEKKNFTNAALIREISDPAQGGIRGPTVIAYQKALDILEQNKDFEMSVFTIPGIKSEFIVDEAINLATRRTDVFYIFDVQERDEDNLKITGSFAPKAESLTNTRNAFTNNPRQTTYAAAYFPDMKINVGTAGSDVFLPMHKVPATVCVLERFGSRDDHTKIIGTTNGAINAVESTVAFTDEDLDSFFQDGINLLSGPTLEEGGAGTGIFIRSQNTLMTEKTPLSRVSVRRMLLFVRKEVKKVMKNFHFQNLTAGLYGKIRSELGAKLAELQTSGLYKFYQLKVPNTIRENPEDVNKNLVRIKILIRPHDASSSLIVDMEEKL